MSASATVQSEFAKRQLERMGWKEGNGLGKDRQGRAAPIIVKQRSDVTGGLGIEKEKVRQVQQTIQDEWWKDALGDTLSKLCDKKEKKKKRKRGTGADNKNSEVDTSTETTKRKKIFTDEELFIATGGARFGMRAGKTRNQAKWRRTEDCETELVVQQQQQVNDETATDSTTLFIAGVESPTNVEQQTIQCDDSSNQKIKSNQLRLYEEKIERDKRADSKQKKKKEKQKTMVLSEAEPPNTETTISANPLREEKRKKKKSKKASIME